MQKNQMSKKSNLKISKRGRIGEGRPRKYTDLQVFQKKIDEYFVMCDEKKLVPSVIGLALALGFTSRFDILRYEGREEFSGAVKKAKSMIESALIQRLHGTYPTGAIFDLKNNFGYRDVQEIEHSGPGGEPLELGNLDLAARILSILALGKARREAKELPEKVENSENPTPANPHE